MRLLHPAFGHHFVIVHQAPASSDPWLNIVLGVAAVATTLGVFAGGYLAARYGRKASVSISAEAHTIDGGVVIATRPVVRAVGLFRVKFKDDAGAAVWLTEMYLDDQGGLSSGSKWKQDNIFGPSFVEGGEDLTSTVLFHQPEPKPRVVGWRVSIEITVANRLLPGKGWSWADQVFVPKP